MLFRLIENGEERVEAALVDGDATLIERKRHRLQFPPEFGRTSTRRPWMHPKCDVINLLQPAAAPQGGSRGSRYGSTTARVSALETTGTISNVTPQSRHSRIQPWMSFRSSQRISWNEREKLASTQLST